MPREDFRLLQRQGSDRLWREKYAGRVAAARLDELARLPSGLINGQREIHGLGHAARGAGDH